MSKTYTDVEAKKLTQVIDNGIKTLQDIAYLRDGLKDTVKALAEELDIKPAKINKAIRVAFKDSLEDEKEGVTDLEEILAVAKKA